MCSAVVAERSYKIVWNTCFSVEYREKEGFRIVADNCNGVTFFNGTDQVASTILEAPPGSLAIWLIDCIWSVERRLIRGCIICLCKAQDLSVLTVNVMSTGSNKSIGCQIVVYLLSTQDWLTEINLGSFV